MTMETYRLQHAGKLHNSGLVLDVEKIAAQRVAFPQALDDL